MASIIVVDLPGPARKVAAQIVSAELENRNARHLIFKLVLADETGGICALVSEVFNDIIRDNIQRGFRPAWAGVTAENHVDEREQQLLDTILKLVQAGINHDVEAEAYAAEKMETLVKEGEDDQVIANIMDVQVKICAASYAWLAKFHPGSHDPELEKIAAGYRGSEFVNPQAN